MTTNAPPKNKGLHISLWITQVLLAMTFAMAGIIHATTPMSAMPHAMAWTGAAPEAMVRLIGASELIGALGLVLPDLTRIRPVLTIWAAICLSGFMVLASLAYLSRREERMFPIFLLLGGLCAFIAWGRARKVPITPDE